MMGEVPERMAREAPMKGKNEAFLRSVREFRDNFDLRRGGATIRLPAGACSPT